MSLDVNVNGDGIEYLCKGKEDDETGFNTVIGFIEDILIMDEFQALQTKFLDKYWKHFDNNEENKHIYMEIFGEYQKEIEQYIENYLKEQILGFCMDTFIQELIKKRKELDGEIFDMLFTFSDFISFKEMFLDYKAMKEGKTIDLSSNISITKIFYVQD